MTLRSGDSSDASVDALLSKLRTRIASADTVSQVDAPGVDICINTVGSPQTPAALTMREGGGTPISSIPRYRELIADRVLMSAASKALEGPDALTRCGARGAKGGVREGVGRGGARACEWICLACTQQRVRGV